MLGDAVTVNVAQFEFFIANPIIGHGGEVSDGCRAEGMEGTTASSSSRGRVVVEDSGPHAGGGQWCRHFSSRGNDIDVFLSSMLWPAFLACLLCLSGNNILCSLENFNYWSKDKVWREKVNRKKGISAVGRVTDSRISMSARERWRYFSPTSEIKSQATNSNFRRVPETTADKG